MVAKTLTSLVWAAAFAAAAPSDVASACADIKAAAPGKLFYPQDSAYKLENTDYYNIGLAELMPACILQATKAIEVSEAVKILNKYKDVPFAVKSGGHDPNPGHSSVKGGVLIALSKMSTVKYDKATRTAQFGPGGHWSSVIAPLDKQGVTVVGGRLGIVGVGGLVMQLGISFLSTQYGMAGDNVKEYEMVLANGTIANISYEKHPELVRAMRGSGDQFGIATKFTAEAHPIGQIWGGIRLYANVNKKDALLEALYDFAKNQRDPKAAIIFTHAQPLGLTPIYMLFFFYDGPTVPAGAFGKFMDITPTINMCKTRSYTDMMEVASVGGASTGQSAGGKGKSNPLAALMGGNKNKNKGKGKSKNSNALSSLFGGGKGKSKASKGSNNVLSSLTALLGGKGANARLPEEEIAAAWLENYLRLHKPEPEEKLLAADVMAARTISTEKERNAPPPSTETTAPRSAAMGARTSFRSMTLPVSSTNWFPEIQSIWTNVTAAWAMRHPSVTGTIAFQPFGPLIGAQSEKRGGNAMGLTGRDPARFIVEIAFLWKDKSLDADIARLSKEFWQKVQARGRAIAAKSSAKNYYPYFMNDAAADQDVTSSYKDAAKFARLQKQMDPEGLWTRTGSFKYKG